MRQSKSAQPEVYRSNTPLQVAMPDMPDSIVTFSLPAPGASDLRKDPEKGPLTRGNAPGLAAPGVAGARNLT